MTSSTRPYELNHTHVKRYDVNSTMYRMTSSTRPCELSPAHVKRYDVNYTMYRNDVMHTSV